MDIHVVNIPLSAEVKDRVPDWASKEAPVLPVPLGNGEVTLYPVEKVTELPLALQGVANE